MKVLHVDDSKAMRMIVQRTVKKAGFDVTFVEACDGVEGLKMVEAEHPNLILSDWNMPEMNGIEFLRKLRADGNLTTFGFVTSESTSETKEQANEAGAAFIINKPFTPDSFQTILSSYIR